MNDWPSLDATRCTVPAAVEQLAQDHAGELFLVDATEGERRRLTFGQVCDGMNAVAGVLGASGVRAGDTVAVLAPNGSFLLLALLGIQRAGAVSLILYPPNSNRSAEYRRNLLDQLSRANAKGLVVAAEYQDSACLPAEGEVLGLEFVLHAEALSSVAPPPAVPVPRDTNALAHLQFTSGSTGRQRGVATTHQSIVDNVRSMQLGFEVSERDRLVSWLPMAHDMGLIGAVLMPLLTGFPVWLMRPSQFVLRPLNWLQAMTEFRATIAFSPNFGYQRCVNAIGPEPPGVDLSSLALAVCAAEPVIKTTMVEFYERFRPYGFRNVLCPAYGLAENTVGVAACPRGRAPRFEELNYSALTTHGRAERARGGEPRVAVCCVGRAFQGVQVAIVDDAGKPLGDRVVGEVLVGGRGVARGYQDDPQAHRQTFTSSGLRTGDYGYLVDGELFITGRKKDIIIHAGRNYHPQDIEAAVLGLDGVEQAVAFGVPSERKATEDIVLMVGTKAPNRQQDALIFGCRRAIRDQLDVAVEDVVLVARRAIPKTTSGKLRRAECRRLYLEMKERSYGAGTDFKNIA